MNKPTPYDLAHLDRLERKLARELRFLRHTPREHECIPFVQEDTGQDRRDAVVGAVALVVMVAALATMPWWF